MRTHSHRCPEPFVAYCPSLAPKKIEIETFSHMSRTSKSSTQIVIVCRFKLCSLHPNMHHTIDLFMLSKSSCISFLFFVICYLLNPCQTMRQSLLHRNVAHTYTHTIKDYPCNYGNFSRHVMFLLLFFRYPNSTRKNLLHKIVEKFVDSKLFPKFVEFLFCLLCSNRLVLFLLTFLFEILMKISQKNELLRYIYVVSHF